MMATLLAYTFVKVKYFLIQCPHLHFTGIAASLPRRGVLQQPVVVAGRCSGLRDGLLKHAPTREGERLDRAENFVGETRSVAVESLSALCSPGESRKEPSIMSNRSEVARIRQQIELELEAMRNGMLGLAQGVARHNFIQVRMERVGVYQDELAAQIGDYQASSVLCQLYEQVMEQDEIACVLPEPV